jgi:hypothetical protein
MSTSAGIVKPRQPSRLTIKSVPWAKGAVIYAKPSSGAKQVVDPIRRDCCADMHPAGRSTSEVRLHAQRNWALM